MHQLLHEFDIAFSGTLMPFDTLSQKDSQYFLLSSAMEEAIASGQMEGASTTRRVAKDMLRKRAKPRNKDQQMIVNNYNTIRFLAEHKDRPLDTAFLLEIHRSISEKTLADPMDEGAFRSTDDIVVMDELRGKVAHLPPSHTEIGSYIADLCDFANSDHTYIHPIVKAIIIHFIISYVHPFSDGNGRTARALFYWYLLKKGYRLMEFLSVSRIIYRSKEQYERAFLYAEHDGLDMGYFIQYNLESLKKSFDELKNYLNRKAQEAQSVMEFTHVVGMNERQRQIMKMAIKRPSAVFVCKELEPVLSVSAKTLRADLSGLVDFGLLEAIPINRRLTGYRKAHNFEERMSEIRENKGK